MSSVPHTWQPVCPASELAPDQFMEFRLREKAREPAGMPLTGFLALYGRMDSIVRQLSEAKRIAAGEGEAAAPARRAAQKPAQKRAQKRAQKGAKKPVKKPAKKSTRKRTRK